MRRSRLLLLWQATYASLLLGVAIAVPAQQLSSGATDSIVSVYVDELLQTLSTADAQADATTIALQSLAIDEQLPLSLREQILHEFALQMRGQSRSTAGEQALRWLSGYDSQVRVQHHGRGPEIIPQWRVAGVARGTLALQADAAAVTLRQRQVETGTLDLSAEAAQAERLEDGEALAQVLATAPPEQLLAYRDRLLTSMSHGTSLAPAATEVALRLQDIELGQAVLDSGDRRSALRLVTDIGDVASAEAAYPLLRVASTDDKLASTAILAIGRVATDVSAAQDYLLTLLGDPLKGGSAATALAAMNDPAMVSAVAARLDETEDETLQSRAVLMLVLDGSAEAQAHLAEFAERPDTPGHLREKVSQLQLQGRDR